MKQHLPPKILLLLAAILLAALPARAQSIAAAADSLRISLLTCDPGPEIFELYGHQAIRVQTPLSDEVYNYGVFDFNSPGFVYRFVKGETDYMCEPAPTWLFMRQYVRRGSRVIEQELNLTPAEAARLAAILRHDAAPENAVYRYKYCTNNCATRILDNIDAALGEQIVYPDAVPEASTFRRAMRLYDEGYPWYQLGVDLALGYEIDRPITARQKMFVPMILAQAAARAKLSDGRQLVRNEQILYPGEGDRRLPPTSALTGPMAASGLLLLLTLWATFRCFRRAAKGRPALSTAMRLYISAWFLLTGLAGCLVWFLVFVSVHEATSPNLLAWWLNPFVLALIPLLWLRSRRGLRLASGAMAAYSAVVLILLCAWPLLPQTTSPAIFPLMLSSLLMAATGAIMSRKSSYNFKGEAPAKRK